MCSDGWYPNNKEEIDGICPDCGEETIDGEAAYGCYYSSVDCKTCGSRPCDGSC